MRKIGYNTKYIKEFLSYIEHLDCTIDKNKEDITITGGTKMINKCLRIFNNLETPLAYQLEHDVPALVIFDPRI